MIWEQSIGREGADGVIGMQGIFCVKDVYTKNLSYTPNTCINFNVQHAIKWSSFEEKKKIKFLWAKY